MNCRSRDVVAPLNPRAPQSPATRANVDARSGDHFLSHRIFRLVNANMTMRVWFCDYGVTDGLAGHAENADARSLDVSCVASSYSMRARSPWIQRSDHPDEAVTGRSAQICSQLGVGVLSSKDLMKPRTVDDKVFRIKKPTKAISVSAWFVKPEPG
jgi:hypothetical protein